MGIFNFSRKLIFYGGLTSLITVPISYNVGYQNGLKKTNYIDSLTMSHEKELTYNPYLFNKDKISLSEKNNFENNVDSLKNLEDIFK